jgi:hypothetical protein
MEYKNINIWLIIVCVLTNSIHIAEYYINIWVMSFFRSMS